MVAAFCRCSWSPPLLLVPTSRGAAPSGALLSAAGRDISPWCGGGAPAAAGWATRRRQRGRRRQHSQPSLTQRHKPIRRRQHVAVWWRRHWGRRKRRRWQRHCLPSSWGAGRRPRRRRQRCQHAAGGRLGWRWQRRHARRGPRRRGQHPCAAAAQHGWSHARGCRIACHGGCSSITPGGGGLAGGGGRPARRGGGGGMLGPRKGCSPPRCPTPVMRTRGQGRLLGHGDG